MKDRILELIQNKPRHYAAMIKRDAAMMSWINDNTLIDGSLVERIRSAVYGETNVCQYGNTKKVVRINEGWVNCGPAKSCKCTRNEISEHVSQTKRNATVEQLAETQAKRSATMVRLYGVEYNSQRQDIKPILKRSKLNTQTFAVLNDSEWMRTQYVEHGRTSVDIAEELNVHNSTVLDYCRQHGFEIRQYSNYSMQEVRVANYVRSLGLECQERDRTVLDGQEIDVYVPSRQIGIEVNGLLYHSYHPTIFNRRGLPENRLRHLSKTTTAANSGVTLLHYTDHQINNQWDIVSSNIRSKLGLQTRIGARQCAISPVNTHDQKEFFKANHLQGWVASTAAWGLYYQGTLVQCLSVGHNRYRQGELEILRFASTLNTTVVGGLGKLIKQVRKISPNKVITTYCDRDISTGNGYVNAGFTIIGYSKPGYFWTDGSKIVSRYRAQKQSLAKWMSEYDPTLSESENMFKAGYRRFWNCGNIILQYTA